MYGYPGHTKQSVREKLSSDIKWIKEALILLYRYQTDEEKDNDATSEQNGKGFNYHDASILSSYARYLLQGKDLTERQLEEAKKLLPKYAGQILKYLESHSNPSFTD